MKQQFSGDLNKLWDGLERARLSMMRRSYILFNPFFMSQSQKSSRMNEQGVKVQIPLTKLENGVADALSNLIEPKKLVIQILIRKKEFTSQRLSIGTDALVENVEAQSLNEQNANKIESMGEDYYQVLCLFGDQ